MYVLTVLPVESLTVLEVLLSPFLYSVTLLSVTVPSLLHSLVVLVFEPSLFSTSVTTGSGISVGLGSLAVLPVSVPVVPMLLPVSILPELVLPELLPLLLPVLTLPLLVLPEFVPVFEPVLVLSVLVLPVFMLPELVPLPEPVLVLLVSVLL